MTNDYQSLSLFRIAFSLVLLCDFVANTCPYYQDFYGDQGILSLSTLFAESRFPNLIGTFGWADRLNFLPFLLFFYPLSLLAFCIGYHTRAANLLVFCFNTFLFWRNNLIMSGAEDLTRLLLLWCLFLPTNRYWSVDAALEKQCRERPYPTLPFVALRLQISSIYVFSGLFKLAGLAWTDGSAVEKVFLDNILGGTNVGLFFVDRFGGLLTAVTYATIASQILFPVLIYSPWQNTVLRATAILAAAIMHLSFIVFLNIGTFPYICLTMLLLLVPDRWWVRRLATHRRKLASIAIAYDSSCEPCRRLALVLREFLLTPASRIVPIEGNGNCSRQNRSRLEVHRSDGKTLVDLEALRYLLQQSLSLRPLVLVVDVYRSLRPYLSTCDLRRGRAAVSSAFLFVFSRRKEHPPRPIVLWLCALLAFLALTCNLSTVQKPAIQFTPVDWSYGFNDPVGIHPIFDLFQIGQRWNLFAPEPVHHRRDFVIEAVRRDGTRVDLQGYLKPPVWRRESNGYSLGFANHFWLKYFARLSQLTERELNDFGQYLCRLSDASQLSPWAISIKQFVQSASESQRVDAPPEREDVVVCKLLSKVAV